MSSTQKELYLEIKNALIKGDYAHGRELCEEYVMAYPAGLEGWFSYILAVCEVKSTKELINCSVDFSQTDVFEKALENVNEDDRSKLVALAESVSAARKKKTSGVSAGYQEGMQYFVRNIKALKDKIVENEKDLHDRIGQDKAYFKSKSKSIKFFANNFFAFLLSLFMVMMPFLVLYLFFKLSEMQEIFSILALVAGAVALLALTITRLLKQKKASKAFLACEESVCLNEKIILGLNKEIAELKLKLKKVMRIYKFCKKHPRIKERDMAKLRTKFDSAYSGL